MSRQWRSPTPNDLKNSSDQQKNIQKENNSGQKSALAPISGKTANNISNFTIGETRNQPENHFVSLNRQAMESVKGDNMSDSRAMAMRNEKKKDI